jgi:hypothetical protein
MYQQVVSLSQSSCVSPVELTDRRGGEEWGEEPNLTTPSNGNHSILSGSNGHNTRAISVYYRSTNTT